MSIPPNEEFITLEEVEAESLLLKNNIRSSFEEDWARAYRQQMITVIRQRKALAEKLSQDKNALTTTFKTASNPPDASYFRWGISFIKDSPEVAQLRSKYKQDLTALDEKNTAELSLLEAEENRIREAYEKKLRESAALEKANEFIDMIPNSQKLSDAERAWFLGSLYSIEKNKSKKEIAQENKGLFEQMKESVQNFASSPPDDIAQAKKRIEIEIEEAIRKHELLELRPTVDEKISKYPLFNTLSENLQQVLKKEMTEAILNNQKKLEKLGSLTDPVMTKKIKEEFKNLPGVRRVGRKIRVAAELLKIPNFKECPLEDQLKFIDETAIIMKKLAKIRRDIHDAKIPPEHEKLPALNATEAALKADLKKITIRIQTKLAADDTAVIGSEIEEKALDERVKNLSATALPTRPTTQTSPFLTALDYVWPRGAAAIAAYNRWPSTQQDKKVTLKDIVMYLPNEILDIINKENAYIDRTFRGSMMVGTAVAVIAAAALIGNPFTGFPVLAALGGLGLVAGAAKLSKWISNKTAENVYGVSNPDRYNTLTRETEKYFGKKQAKKIQKYFFSEIKSITKQINAANKISSEDTKRKELRRLQSKLTETEKAWGAIRNPNEQTTQSAWKAYVEIIFPEKRAEHWKAIESETAQNLGTVIDALSAATRPEEKTKNVLPEAAQPQEKKEDTDFLLKKSHHKKTASSYKKIRKLKKIDQLVKNRPGEPPKA